jgi:hypothetical protein
MFLKPDHLDSLVGSTNKSLFLNDGSIAAAN